MNAPSLVEANDELDVPVDDPIIGVIQLMAIAEALRVAEQGVNQAGAHGLIKRAQYRIQAMVKILPPPAIVVPGGRN